MFNETGKPVTAFVRAINQAVQSRSSIFTGRASPTCTPLTNFRRLAQRSTMILSTLVMFVPPDLTTGVITTRTANPASSCLVSSVVSIAEIGSSSAANAGPTRASPIMSVRIRFIVIVYGLYSTLLVLIVTSPSAVSAFAPIRKYPAAFHANTLPVKSVLCKLVVYVPLPST